MEPIRWIRAGNLIDGRGGEIQKNVWLRIIDGRVDDILSPNSLEAHLREPEKRSTQGSGILDLSEYTILPGLVDSHLHLFMSGTGDTQIREKQLNAGFDEIKPTLSRHLKQLVACGVVAARDGGDFGGYAHRYRSECVESDPIPVYLRTAGKAWRKPGRYGKLIGRPPLDGESLAEAVSRTAAGVDHVKIVNSGLNSLFTFGKETLPQFDSTELRAGVRAAHDRGLRVMIHCNGTAPVQIAVEAGCDSIEHGFFMGPDNLKRMADRGTVWVPTAVTMKAYSERLPPESPEAEIARRNFDHQVEQIRLARELGVTIAVGTDAGSLGVHHGIAVKQELKILTDAGYSVSKAIACATANGARLLDLNELGTLQTGKAATWVAAKGHPQDLPDSLASIRLFISGREIERTFTKRGPEPL
ncbi:MAG: amidohydrolase family protein [Thermodesulfobacteriota bacterium]